jgi:carboxymethylenebutenolidase
MAGRQIGIAAADGGMFGIWLALPENGAGPGPGIVMLHEIFGVTGWIRETAEMFASHGYCVAAPDMFWRLEPGFEGDFRDAEQTARGRSYKAALDHETGLSDIAAVIAHLKSLPQCNGKIGVTGFCTGGTMAYLTAARLGPDAASCYYGTQIHEFLEEGRNIECPSIFHMGLKDDRVPEGLSDTARAAWDGNPNTTIHTYDAGHAFAHTERDDYYLPDAAKLAHARTFELFDGLK